MAGLGWRLGAMLLSAALGTGCASASHIHVRSTALTNDGNTLYLMVRSTDRATASENYQDAAARLFAEPPDPSVVMSQPIIPGNATSVTLEESSKDVVLYFFFTEPGASWRLPLPKPLPSEVYIDLGQHQIERVQARRR